jgi:hypothetical protein
VLHHEPHPSDGDIIELNCGGAVMVTSRSTLRQVRIHGWMSQLTTKAEAGQWQGQCCSTQQKGNSVWGPKGGEGGKGFGKGGHSFDRCLGRGV